MYEIVKALHIIAVITWFAGLFYMPRLFIYHLEVLENSKSNNIFKTMEKKLYFYITTPAMILTWLCGLYLVKENIEIVNSGSWLHAKILLVFILTGFHISMDVFRRKFRDNINTTSSKFFRFYNEIPTFILIIVVFLVVLKPF